MHLCILKFVILWTILITIYGDSNYIIFVVVKPTVRMALDADMRVTHWYFFADLAAVILLFTSVHAA